MSAARDDILAGLRAAGTTTIGDASPEELLDRYRAEVLREAADAVDAGKAVFPEDVRSGASWAARMLRRMAETAEEKATPTSGASATPQLDDRLGRLADHILSHGGEWTTSKAHAWFVTAVDPNFSWHRARHALQHLHALGYLTEHDRLGRRSYTPNYPKADA